MAEKSLLTHDGFPALQNPDGTYSTELSITVTDPRLNGGRPTNIPSLWGGRVLPEDRAVSAALASGRPYAAFADIPSAVSAARARSDAGGAGAGAGKRGVNWLISGLNKGLVSDTLGGPVDMATIGLNALIAGGGYLGHKAGLLDAPPDLIDKPVGGSDWINSKLAALGMANPEADTGTPEQAARLVSGLIGPTAIAGAAVKAPDIAAWRNAVKAIEESGIGRMPFRSQRGAVVYHGFPGNEGLLSILERNGQPLAAEPLSKFGGKAAREATLAKKVAKAAQAVAGTEASSTAAKRGARAKIAPDLFRTMEKEQGSEATLAAIRRGAHLKPDGKGGYIGAPRTVDSPQALGALRRSADEQFSDSVEALQHADPDRVGTWYDRAKAAQARTNEPWQLPRSLEQHGVYSAGVSPESELGFALKHANSRALGEPTMAYRSAPAATLDNAVAQGRPANMGFKIGEYRDKNDPRLPNTGLFGVNDFRAAQGMHYTKPDGSIWRGGVSPTMHPFMDGETALVVDRANQAGIGGRTNWQGPHVQELPWVYGKAQDLYGRGKNARFSGPAAQGQAAALREANNTMEDYLYKHAGAATHEAIPGYSTGHVPSLLSADEATKQAYTEAGRWDRPGPEGGPNNIDAIYSALGLRQLPSVKGSGGYLNSAGQFETNPLTVARPLLDFPTGGGGGRVAPLTGRAMNSAEKFRAVADAQEAGAWNLPNTSKRLKGKNSLVFDTRGRNPTDGALPPGNLLAKVNAILDPQGYFMAPTARGAVVMPYDPSASPKDLAGLLKGNRGLLGEIPGEASPGVTSSGYVPGIGKWGAAGIEPTRPFSGEATMGLLQDLAEAPPEIARNLSESEGIRSILREKIARDAALPGARKDIQNMRAFLSEADWNRAVEMIRAGTKPAAALAALGYSAASLAAAPEGR